jgi:group II intron reverse transcriptase/maturase
MEAPAVAQYTGKGSIGLSMIRKAAERDGSTRFTSLLHHLTEDLLCDAFYALKRDAALGVDEVTWQDYNSNLNENLVNLYRGVQNGKYRATPSKRIYLAKPDGSKRPIGIAALEDKIVQMGLCWILNQIYEVDFKAYSYGFRPGKSQHNALDAVSIGLMKRKVNWILDADIRGFFDKIDHQWLVKFLEHRISDKRVIRLIQKWLRAGVSDDGEWSKQEVGTPQGSVISPLLANIYLHYALDLWVENWRKTRAKGDVTFVRFADDFVVGFQMQNEAEHFLEALKYRLAKFGLELHEQKTRLIEFGRFAKFNRAKRGERKPETFDFLGFTHICDVRKSDGYFTVTRKTISKRMSRKLVEIHAKLLKMRHLPVPTVGKWIRSVINGHYNYFAVPGNYKSISTFRYKILKSWLNALRRRSQKGGKLTWKKFNRLTSRFLPVPKIKHPYPNQRLCVR